MLKYGSRIVGIGLLILLNVCSFAQFTHQDSLRGSNGPGRDFWDVKYYDLSITPDYVSKTIVGKNKIHFQRLNQGWNVRTMQIDLQAPMVVDSVIYENTPLKFQRDGN